MANTITKTVLEEGPRNLVVLVSIVGDGSGDETNTIIIDRSTFTDTTSTKTALLRTEGNLSGFTARLLYDATTKLVIAAFPDGNSFDNDWRKIGGVSSSKAGAGFTGDILLTTVGLGAGETGAFTLYMRKD